MAQRVLEVILEAIAVFEHSLAQVTVIFVVRRGFDMVQKCGLIWELERADAAPVLVWVVGLVSRLSGGS
jgi:hypothetical protein